MLYNSENLHGGDIYEGNIELDFSANTNPFGMPEGVKRAVVRALENAAHYPDPYCRKLVSAIAEHENVPKEYVLCGAGAAELIYAFAHSERPGSVLELAPTFAEYSLPAEGALIVRHFLSEENDFRLTPSVLRQIEETKPDAVFICDPNNPTGLTADAELIEETARLCERLGIRLFIDECFMDLADENKSFVPRLSHYPNAVVLKAFTKSFGMAGIRLGYCLTADRGLLARMSRQTQQWNVSVPAQEAGAAALKETEFLEKTRKLIRAERERLSDSLMNMGFIVFPSEVNYLLFKGEAGLCEKLLEKGVKIRDCSNYHGLGEGFYRIAVKLPEENERLIKAVSEVLQWQKT